MNERYPYYIYPAIEALPEATGAERERLLRRLAVGVGPVSALRTLTGIDPEEFRDFYGELEQPDLDTDDTISEFIDRFGAPHLADVRSEAVEDIPVAPPAVDFTAQLAAREELPMQHDDTADLLDAFLNTAPAPGQAVAPARRPEPEPEPKTEAQAPQQTLGEEALAKIMVKNGNYRKALEIITDLNLKNPKKSVYFADQMRFLQKLILMQERSGQGNQ